MGLRPLRDLNDRTGMIMHEVSILEAWHVWRSGGPTVDLILWGYPIRWWGRIGQLAQFIGALTVTLDLIGPTRLRAWGRTLHPTVLQSPLERLNLAIQQAGRLAAALANEVRASRRLRRGAILRSEQELMAMHLEEAKRAERYWADLEAHGVKRSMSCLSYLLWVLALFAIASVGSRVLNLDPDSPWIWIVAWVMAVGGGLLLMAIPMLFYVSKTIVGVGIDYLFARPLAAVLDTSHPGLWIKWLGVLLLVLGFHFDLLAS